ncbi:MAG: Hsp33 family molecular chaperone HslO [Clostridia bacterium]|nr:Hsp33 family molecular chaperone HslO [Clostridia bacterium]MBN2882270.1 Hsp33 family molecular chaperone HslO [Clostridia bacterium]
MSDKVVRASAYNDMVRAFAVDIRTALDDAIGFHKLNPLSAIALGRALAGAAMISEMGKSDETVTTIKIKGKGPMGGLVAVASKGGTLKGYVVNNNYADYGDDAKLGVGPLIGEGTLTIVRDLGMKEPYSGTIPLQSGEIGDDLAYYFTYSEQIPSLVALGVKLNPDATTKTAAGIIVQLMPGAGETTISEIEQRLFKAGSASSIFEKTGTPQGMLEYLLEKGNPEITSVRETGYKCGCSRDSMKRGVISLGREELEKIINEQDIVEAVCHFCETRYTFSSSEIKNLIIN